MSSYIIRFPETDFDNMTTQLEDVETHDAAATEAKYEELVTAAVLGMYPSAEVQFEGYREAYVFDYNGILSAQEQEEIKQNVMEIASDIFVDGAFWVERTTTAS